MKAIIMTSNNNYLNDYMNVDMNMDINVTLKDNKVYNNL